MTGNLIKISAAAPMPLMVAPAAAAFEKLRKKIASESGRDFLARLADCYRSPDYKSSKRGVADRSWHKTGRAFDYDQTSPHLVITKELVRGALYFRTFIRCAAETNCELVTVNDYRGWTVTGRLYDFTAAAESLGWQRIPAWRGWQRNYNLREFWHYQFTEGLTLDEALKGTAKAAFLRLGQKGTNVRRLQAALAARGFMQPNEVDGIFGLQTQNALRSFQRFSGLEPDGIAGTKTLFALGLNDI